MSAQLDRFRRGATAAACLALAGLAAPAAAAELYAGKEITLVVGNDPGSGYDSYARLLARHMARHIPGAPVFVVRNMPGAGSIIAAQHLANVAPKDGTTFGTLFPGALLEPLTGDASKARYDPAKFEYIGTADSGTRLCLTTAASGVRTIEDARRAKVVMAGTAPGSSTTDYAWFMNALAGTKFEVVTGYQGPGAILLAMERGEAAGVCALDSATIASMRPTWIAEKKINLLVQAGLEENAELAKAGAPPLWAFLKGQERAVAELIVSQQVFGRPFLAPPGVPAEPMRILRTAFMATMADPALLEEARKMKLDINPKDGEAVAKVVRALYAAPPDLVEKMRHALRPQGK
ncbi:MAG TPA: tripartite tricarboxylate transporter substrate-binding protein [Beijerinckiaceae bacterium]